MDNTKRIIAFLLMILSIVALISCGEQKKLDSTAYFQRYNFRASNYVELYDYKNINVDSDYIEVLDSDIVTVIEMDMEYYDCMKVTKLIFPEEDFYVFLRIVDVENNSAREQYYLFGSEEFGSQFESTLKKTGINESFVDEIDGIECEITNMGIFEPATIKDEKIILDFYELKSMDEVYEYIRNKTRINIIFYYMMDKILENTTIISLPPVVKESYDEYSASFWNDIIIYKAILEAEGKELTESEFERALEEAAAENMSTVSGIFEENADSVLHYALEQKLKNILVNYINEL